MSTPIRERAKVNRREFLSAAKLRVGYGLLGAGCSNAVPGPFDIDQTEVQLPDEADPPLREAAASAGLAYGAAMHSSRLKDDEEFAAVIARECDIIVPESEMKWKVLRPSPDSFDFRGADRLLKFASDSGLKLRGHTLVWHAAMPQWAGRVLNAANAERHLVQHVDTVVRRYAGVTHSWDVVNEAIAPEDGEVTGMRRSLWHELLGPDYVELAFRAAAEADPDATLIYNEARLDYHTKEHEACRIATLMLMERLVKRGVPIHGIGIQAHLDATETRFDGPRLQRFLRRLADLGLRIYITELDVSEQGLVGSVQERDRAIAAVYGHYLDVVLEEPAVEAVLTWGLSDRYSWLGGTAPRSDGEAVRPLPLDLHLRRKLAWQAMAETFRHRARDGRSHMAESQERKPVWRDAARRLDRWPELHRYALSGRSSRTI